MKYTDKISRRTFVVSGVGTLAMTALPGLSYPEPSNKAMKLAEKHKDELVGLLQDLIRVQSLSGESAANAQTVVKQYLSKLPYRIEESSDRPSSYETHPEYMPPDPPSDGPFVNVVGWPERNKGQQFAMFSHIDTESVYEVWDSNPHESKLVGNKLYGLGAADDKGGVAAMLIAAKVLSKAGGPLPVVMSLHGKGGGSRGSLPVFDRISKSEHRLGAVLYVHPAETGRGLDDVKNSVQGILDLKLTVTGWRGRQMEIGSVDSASWNEGGSAVDLCWQLLELLRETVFENVKVNVGTMKGGDRIGSVADTATATFRLKFEDQHTWRDLLINANQKINEFIISKSNAENKYQAKLDTVGYRTNPGAASWDAPVSQVLRESIEEISGKAPNAYPNHYAGDIRYPIRLLNVPAYGIGSLGGNFYGPNEWVDVDDLVKLVAVCIQTISGWQKI